MAKQICEKCGAKDSIKIDKNEDTAFCIKCWYTQTKESSFTVITRGATHNLYSCIMHNAWLRNNHH